MGYTPGGNKDTQTIVMFVYLIWQLFLILGSFHPAWMSFPTRDSVHDPFVFTELINWISDQAFFIQYINVTLNRIDL